MVVRYTSRSVTVEGRIHPSIALTPRPSSTISCRSTNTRAVRSEYPSGIHGSVLLNRVMPDLANIAVVAPAVTPYPIG